MSEEKNKFIGLYHFLDKPQDFNLEMNYYEFRDELKNLLDLYQKEKEKNKDILEKYYEAVDKMNNNYLDILNSYISKDKIKELINKRGNNGYTSLDCIEDIEELLEERN